MEFKLVRTDTEEPRKIRLPCGTHLIGRGKFLSCDDRRVSRNHGHLEVTVDTITLKSLHQNPCFYIRRGTKEVRILKQSESLELSNGDQFGLLPDSYWYEVMLCSAPDGMPSPDIANEENTEKLNEEAISATLNCSNNTIHEENNLEPNNSIIDHGDNVQPQGNESPSLLPRLSPDEGNESPSVLPPQETTETVVSTENPPLATNSQESIETDKTESQPPKRGHSEENTKEEMKKVKLEPEEIKQEPDAQPGPSGDQGAAQSSNDSNNNGAAGHPPSPQKPPQPLGRERCMYGANCYRRNPQHKSQFSHPTDSDWGTGDRGVCPYGAGCRRTDPRHWRDHTHPPGTVPQPHRQPARKRRPKRQKESDDDSEEDTQAITADENLIVTGKRARKTIKRESWSSSEEEKDPFGTDESDEWQPDGGSLNDSQYTQDI